MGISDFFIIAVGDVQLMIATLLIFGVVFVNGWTDAPGAITASVSTGAIKMKNAAILAAVFNFFGAACMGIANPSVMNSVSEITMMIGNGENSLKVLCAAMLSIIVWAVAAWYFGIPTSESHALISGIIGAALAVGAEVGDRTVDSLWLAAIGLIFSLPVGCLCGLIVSKILKFSICNIKSENRENFLRRGQIFGAAAMSFMHGAQDSQKFAGVLVAAMCMTAGVPSELGVSNAPNWVSIVCALIIATGTSVGGYRIIKKVGMETVRLTPQKGLASDISAAFCMLLASIGGIPVSTTHTSSASIIGAGISDKDGDLNLSSLREMLLAWVLTFPCCGLLSYLFAKLMVNLF